MPVDGRWRRALTARVVVRVGWLALVLAVLSPATNTAMAAVATASIRPAEVRAVWQPERDPAGGCGEVCADGAALGDEPAGPPVTVIKKPKATSVVHLRLDTPPSLTADTVAAIGQPTPPRSVDGGQHLVSSWPRRGPPGRAVAAPLLALPR